MYKLTMAIFAVFASQSTYASCTKLVQSHKYLLKEGVEYCLEIENKYVLLEMGKGTDMAEISDKNKTVFEIMYPEEQLIIQDQFIVTSFADMHITYSNDFIYLENAPKKRRKRNAVEIVKAGRSAALSVAGSRLAGGEADYAPEIIGGMFAAVSGPVAGPLIGGYIIEDIKRRGKDRRPLTRIDINKGFSSSGMRTYSRVSSARIASCYAGCHS
ncbi:hypothetical protein VAS14_15922 [Vibrio angustum S14]|uniref:Uncharacterized protein n=1 Tax=Photobacterium angustum (strain S14 / CCUG 15956) TaxID=314292 RepID=Q1ZMF6_PHOAS|nr:hypothetical protein [Photobacterium angustum]EAS63284.1 hypothetical protein VAS14_15922 [Vibrio angustum S14] [Photobacterium angustum S14]